MIQDIHPHRLDMEYRRDAPRDGDYVVALKGGRVLFVSDGDGNPGYLPEYGALRAANPALDGDFVYLFSADGKAYHFYAGDTGEGNGLAFQHAMSFRNYQPVWMAFAGITASHLALWYAGNRFCGACGGPMTLKADERAVNCASCGAIVYPRISPAVIVGVVDGERILVTSYVHRPSSRTALIAGFMEIGETFEDTVRREVMEEVGLKVKNIRYYKSQPWAFSGSVLVGFFADLDGSPEITLDTGELQEALWMSRDEMSPIDTSISLTSEMMELFRVGNHPRAN